jgi:hypothetical protein
MRMKKPVSRAKKQDRHPKRTRTAIAGLGVVLAVTGAIAASRLASPTPAAPTATPTLSPERIAENRKAQAELGSAPVSYAGTSPASGAPTTATAKSPAVTLTGCLEQHGDDFRLKDAAGPDAPRSRSWKSGFIKKSTPTLDVIDASHRLKLKDHVGQRVSLSGVLVEHEVHARSLKNVASSCS